MADIMLHTSNNSGFTCVSNTFIDDFMKDANGEYVKTYLYLLRCLNKDGYEFSIEQLADCLDHTEKDVMRAFTYWEKVGLLHLEYSSDNELSGICLVDANNFESAPQADYAECASPFVASAPVHNPAPTTTKTNKTLEITRPSYSPDDLKAFKEEADVSDLLFVTQTYMGRPLSTSDTTTLLFWYDSLHMTPDLIQYLIETCIDNGHNSFHYMDTVARNWAEDGITTVEAARKTSADRNSTVFGIKKAMGISGRDLVEAELNYIDKWTNTYSFGLDIIGEACTRTITQTNRPSFKYADSILTKWYKASVKSLDDIAKLDEDFQANNIAKVTAAKTRQSASASRTAAKPKATNNKFNNFPQRECNFEALEKKLLGY